MVSYIFKKNRGDYKVKYYQLVFGDDNYCGLTAKDTLTYDFMQSFDGRNHSKSWLPLRVRKESSDKEKPLSDAPYFFVPVFSKKALECLYAIMADDVEVLPLEYDDGEYYAINVVSVIDVIDYEKSDFIKFNNSDKIMLFKSYAFCKDKIKDQNIFKIIDEPRRRAFVSEKFKQIVDENHLTGFNFEFICDI